LPAARKFFGTNGIRGIPGKDISLEFIAEMCQSIGTYLGNSRPVLVGNDVRNSSPSLAKAALSGLLSAGNNANSAGLAPTPAHQYGVRTLGYGGGVIVTASHNPAQYNGIKLVGPDGVEVRREDEALVESIYLEKKYNRPDWQSVGRDGKETRVVENYISGVMSQVDVPKISARKFTVVLDVGNGAQAVAAPFLCERLGSKVISINGQADGNFPGRGPEPTPAVLKDMCEAVKSYRADFGVAYDGDGDRSLFCDENGEIYWGDRTGSMLVDYLLQSKHKGGPVVTTVSTSSLVGLVAEKHGANVIWTTVGSVDVSRAMIDNNAPLGLEENGGFFYGPHIPVRDGAMTTALVMDALAHKRTSFSKAISELKTFYQKKAKFECPNEKRQKVMAYLESKSGMRRKVDKTDGLKIWTDDNTWILLRPSGTEPLIRVYAESDDQKKLENMFNEFEGLLKDAIASS
jgi:phosphomannomutase / phosphoglucomutase